VLKNLNNYYICKLATQCSHICSRFPTSALTVMLTSEMNFISFSWRIVYCIYRPCAACHLHK